MKNGCVGCLAVVVIAVGLGIIAAQLRTDRPGRAPQMQPAPTVSAAPPTAKYQITQKLAGEMVVVLARTYIERKGVYRLVDVKRVPSEPPVEAFVGHGTLDGPDTNGPFEVNFYWDPKQEDFYPTKIIYCGLSYDLGDVHKYDRFPVKRER